jgi:hypothetical protein
MLKRKETDFLEYLWAAVGRVGRSAPRVTDEIIEKLFPDTCKAADREGAFAMFRQGVVNAVKSVIRGKAPNEHQIDFASIDPSSHSIAEKLRSNAYFVPSADCQMTVDELIADPSMLDEARKFMRQKGLECLEEADRLDDLYEAVTDNPKPRPRRRRANAARATFAAPAE